VEDTEKTYLVGDTITANIQAYSQKSETSNLYGFDIKLDYDNTLLSLTKLESSISGATKNVTTGAVSYGIKNGDGVGLKQNEATTLATATFTVISAGDEGTATIGLKDGTEVTEAWSSGQDTTNDAVKPEITSAEVTLKAIEVSVLPEGVSISEDEAKAAKAGQTFTFTPIVPEGSTILVATATSNEEAVPVTKGENGVYSIAESDVKGDIAITVYTASEITRDLRTIQATEEEETDTYVLYFPEGKDRVIIKTDKLESGNYALTGCDELYYSELYQGYVGFISAEQEELAFSLTDSAVTEIKHDGDVNLNGSVTSNDAVNIYNTINGKTKALAGQKMLEMDVDADGKVSVNDIQAILNLSVGLAKDYTEGES
jgi:hypothetical protein